MWKRIGFLLGAPAATLAVAGYVCFRVAGDDSARGWDLFTKSLAGVALVYAMAKAVLDEFERRAERLKKEDEKKEHLTLEPLLVRSQDRVALYGIRVYNRGGAVVAIRSARLKVKGPEGERWSVLYVHRGDAATPAFGAPVECNLEPKHHVKYALSEAPIPRLGGPESVTGARVETFANEVFELNEGDLDNTDSLKRANHS